MIISHKNLNQISIQKSLYRDNKPTIQPYQQLKFGGFIKRFIISVKIWISRQTPSPGHNPQQLDRFRRGPIYD